MLRIIALVFVVAGVSLAGPAHGYRIIDADAGFAVDFPTETKSETKKSADTPVSRVWTLEQGKSVWTLTYEQRSLERPHATIADLVKSLSAGKRVTRNAVVILADVSGRELIVSDREVTARYRIFRRSPTELIQLAYVGPFGSEKSAEVNEFMASFQFGDGAVLMAQPFGAAPARTGPGLTILSPDRERALKAKEAFKECDLCPEMVVVPAGSFMMGFPEGKGEANARPQHRVTIARPLAVGKFEVTASQFAAFVAETGFTPGMNCSHFTHDLSQEAIKGNWRDPGYPQRGNHPIVCINWIAADAYTVWLSAKTGKPYRLLSEAEWEYAARAGSSASYSFGNNDDGLCRHGNGLDRSAKKSYPKAWGVLDCTDGYVFAAPVGSFAANAFGLHDMHGNVEEFTEDCWNENYNGAPADGSAWVSLAACANRTTRGGSFSSTGVSGLGAAARNRFSFPYAISESSNTGMRVMRTLDR